MRDFESDSNFGKGNGEVISVHEANVRFVRTIINSLCESPFKETAQKANLIRDYIDEEKVGLWFPSEKNLTLSIGVLQTSFDNKELLVLMVRPDFTELLTSDRETIWRETMETIADIDNRINKIKEEGKTFMDEKERDEWFSIQQVSMDHTGKVSGEFK